MDKILVFNVDIFKTSLLINLFKPLGFEVISVSKQQQGNTIANLLAKKIKLDYCVNPFVASLVVIQTNKEERVDLVLDLLRNHKIMVDYKAVATKHNLKWTAVELFEQLLKERRSLTNG